MASAPETRWDRVKTLFAEAIALDPDARAGWLADACGGDIALRREVDALIDAHFQAGTFLEHGVLDIPDAAGAVAEATQSAAPHVPARFGAYRIERELGRGGMGVVYLAARDDERFDKLVAIKVIAGDIVDWSVLQRFLDERRILASLDHPGIARLLDAGTSESATPYVVMEYVQGEPIDVYCKARQLSVTERLEIFCRVSDAVQYSHEHLVVHRDIKPRNVLVTADGAPKLLDFGIAKLLEPAGGSRHVTRTAFRALTPENASPEQVRGGPVTVASDVYSLGVLLYWLLTERSPYRGDMNTESDVLRAICEEEPQSPSTTLDASRRRELRGDLDLIALKALQKDPARRYNSVLEFSQDIRRHLNRLPILAAPDAWTYRAGKFARRHWLGLGATALVILSLAAGVLATAWQAHVAGIERARADRRFADVRRLANSFLFEFHDAIAPLPGSTKARELVVRRATEYLDDLSKESSDDPSLLRELAASYERVGDVQGLPEFANLGDTAGALRSHQSALTLRGRLAAARPDDTALQRELATTETHVVALFNQTRDSKAALEHALASLAIRQALYDKAPGDDRERRSLAIGYDSLTQVHLSNGDAGAAIESAAREEALFEAVLASNPSNRTAQRDAALANKKLGALLETNGDRDKALEKYQRAIASDEIRLRADPSDRTTQLDLSFSYASLGYLLSTVPDVAGSLDYYGRALELRERAAAADVHDARARETVARAHLSIGQVLRNANRRAEAQQHFQQGLEIYSARRTANPASAYLAQQVANAYSAMAGNAAGAAAASANAPEAARHWRDVRSWAQQSLDIWLAQKAPLSKRQEEEVESLRTLVTKSNASLQ